jgi:hypothetical protein
MFPSNTCNITCHFQYIHICTGRFTDEDAEVANDLPAIPYRKKDKFYRTWKPQALGGYPVTTKLLC